VTSDKSVSSGLRSHFDRTATRWRETYESPQSTLDLEMEDRLRHAMELLRERVAQGATVLDAGCGPGVATVRMTELGYKVVALDISPEMARVTRESLEDLQDEAGFPKVIAGDLMKTDLETGQFDAIVALGFLEYQADQLRTLIRFSSLLKPGGVLVVTGPQTFSFGGFFGLTRIMVRLFRRKSLSLYSYTRTGITRLLRQAGFEAVAVVRHGFAVLPVVERRLIGFSLGRLLDGLLRKASTVVPMDCLCNDIIVCACKNH
jgi:2-polyprenyl-3-methyl-5-hydroxy-6-metoxy-1,4-benzoquinol methylase